MPFPVVAQIAQAAPIRQAAPPSSTNAGRGITVSGSAAARIPATTARITLTLSTADRAMILDSKKVQPIVDALVQAGADPSSVRLPMNFSAPGASNVASIVATVSHPTVAQMQNGIVSVGTVIASLKDVVLNGANVTLTAANCSSAFDDLRHQAVANARTKAKALAEDLGVRLGDALSVTSFEQQTPDGSCSSSYFLNGMGMNGPQGSQDPSDYVSVAVTSSLTITYAIK